MTAPALVPVERTRGRKAPPFPAWIRMVREPGAVPIEAPVKIREPHDVVRFLRPKVGAELVEVFYLLALDSQGFVTHAAEVTRGILNSSLVHPREVFRPAIVAGAAGVIVAHNHPSGDPTPSAEDRAVTRQLTEAGKLLDIPLYDHVILGRADRAPDGEWQLGLWSSFVAAGLL